MKKTRQILSVLLAVLMLVLSAPFAFAEGETEVTTVDGGMCGTNVKWTLDSEGTLVIEGYVTIVDGVTVYPRMTDYSYRIENRDIGTLAPWFHNYVHYDAYGKQTGEPPVKKAIIKGVPNIGASAFRRNYNLTTVEFNPTANTYEGDLIIGTSLVTLKTIGREAFGSESIDRGCSSLQSVILPDTVTTIGSYAFALCYTMEELSLPRDLTNIGESAFSGCRNISNSIVIPEGVTVISESAFASCEKIPSVTLPNTLKTIGPGAFSNCAALSNFVIPDSVTSIGKGAFYHCSSLQNITIPSGVTEIAKETFAQCKLESVNLPNTLIYIGEMAFQGNSLYDLVLPPALKTIGEKALSLCSFSSIYIPASVTSIGESAFSNSRLTDITFGNGAAAIGKYAFRSCTRLQHVTIPGSVTSLGDYAFYECTGLLDANINAGSIGESIFYGCEQLTKVNLGSSVSSVSGVAFSGAKNLASITVDDSNPNFADDGNGLLFSKDMKTLVNYPVAKTATIYRIPESVTAFSAGAFAGAKNLKYMQIPQTVTELSESLFLDCTALRTVSIPLSVTSMGVNAFSTGVLTDVYYEGTETDWSAISKPGLFSLLNPFRNATFHYEQYLPAHEHDYMLTDWVWDADYSAAFATFVCQGNNDHVETQGAVITSETTEPTYTTNGKTVYTATVTFEGNTYSDTKEIEIPMLSHTHDYSAEITVAPTCVTPGTKKYSCICGDSYTEELGIDPTNHVNTENKAAVPSTCTVKGYTAGVYCNDCKTWVSGHEEQPLAAHTPAAAVKENKIAATEEHGGSFDEVVYCSVCGSELSRVTKTTEPLMPETPTDIDIEPDDNQPGLITRIIDWFRSLIARILGFFGIK